MTAVIAVAILIAGYLYWRARRPRSLLDDLGPVDHVRQARTDEGTEP